MADDESLAPTELDALEDALEDLASDTPPAHLGPQARAHFDAYRQIDRLVRETLPPQEPPHDMVQRVLAAAGEELAKAPTPRPRKARSSWRRLFVPTLALAGSAAAVLWWVRHEGGPAPLTQTRTVHEPGARVAAAPGDTKAPPPPATRPRDLEREPARRAAEDTLTPQEQAPAAAPVPARDSRERKTRAQPPSPSGGAGVGYGGGGAGGMLGDEAATGSRAPTKAKKRRRKAGRGGSVGQARPAAQPAPAPPMGQAPARDEADALAKDASREGAAPPLDWNTLADADRARRTGRCGRARELYRALTGAGDRRLAARAHAGLGLCALAQGRSGDAELARARALDPGVAAFIDAERP